MTASFSSSLMASQTIVLTNPKCFFSLPSPPNYLFPSRSLSQPRRTLAVLSPTVQHLFTLSLRPPKFNLLAASATILIENPPNPTHSSLVGSNRILTTVFAVTLSLSKLLASKIYLISLRLGEIFANPSNNPERLAISVRPLFFAAINDGAWSTTSKPVDIISGGISKWIEIFSCVLLVRVLLSWFPNIPWDKQPMSAIRDLCDPYLTIFKGLIPPLFNSLDVSPILAFLLLGTLAQFFRPRP